MNNFFNQRGEIKMVSQTFTITNSQGFHMRPAGTFTSAMGKYQSTVTIVKDGNRIDGKSIMNLIAACIKCGTEITVEIEGPDEEAAMKEAAEMISTGFGE